VLGQGTAITPTTEYVTMRATNSTTKRGQTAKRADARLIGSRRISEQAPQLMDGDACTEIFLVFPLVPRTARSKNVPIILFQENLPEKRGSRAELFNLP